jgi:hypothetical protein
LSRRQKQVVQQRLSVGGERAFKIILRQTLELQPDHQKGCEF